MTVLALLPITEVGFLLGILIFRRDTNLPPVIAKIYVIIFLPELG
jgi:hypothetical protein